MIGFIIRCIVAAITLGFNTYLFYTGYWGWGICMIFISALVVMSFGLANGLLSAFMKAFLTTYSAFSFSSFHLSSDNKELFNRYFFDLRYLVAPEEALRKVI